jgi:prepilin-type N-terminal cleavage/methylation domain-containing protein
MTRRAFTLIETIVVVAVFALISVTLGMLLTMFYRTNAYTLEQSVATAQARKGVEDAMLRLREASYASDGSYPIANVGTSTITFYSNVDSGSAVERITYSVKNGTLYRVVATPTGTPPSYANVTLATTTIATPVVNGTSTPIFRYFDSSSIEIPLPVTISKIASVRTTIIVDVNVNRTPTPLTLSAGATLRNLQGTP